jgi:hypothetical protein
MFTKNKYYNWYIKLIDNAKQRDKIDEYFETHHIVPRCMNGSDDVSNLVKLTAREHFIAHLLLTKFTAGEYKHKMLATVVFMKTPSRNHVERYVNNRLYEQICIEFAKSQSERMTGVPRGPMTDEHKRNIGNANRGRKRPDMTGMNNPAKRPEVRAKIKANAFKWPKGVSTWNKGLKLGDAHRAALTAAKKNKKVIHNDELKRYKYVSPQEIPLFLEQGWEIGKKKYN